MDKEAPPSTSPANVDVGTAADESAEMSVPLDLSYVRDTPALAPSLPSFNSMNEHVRRNMPAYTTKLPDLTRSKIIFDGKTCVREFITRVEDYFVFRNFHEAVLIGSFADLLAGTAAKWFRTIRRKISSWVELRAALLGRFDRPDYDSC
ncbi:unnamed protein product [Arctia plantaginis]|uniref:Retrotransposon gag domain-containing protein n=1 Tax=Arctia plantaginis TaxID=874455 RepID=A0A8S1BG20_ARCPL|nr:unnamed protein product [Arctia plantaginis]